MHPRRTKRLFRTTGCRCCLRYRRFSILDHLYPSPCSPNNRNVDVSTQRAWLACLYVRAWAYTVGFLFPIGCPLSLRVRPEVSMFRRSVPGWCASPSGRGPSCRRTYRRVCFGRGRRSMNLSLGGLARAEGLRLCRRIHLSRSGFASLVRDLPTGFISTIHC